MLSTRPASRMPRISSVITFICRSLATILANTIAKAASDEQLLLRALYHAQSPQHRPSDSTLGIHSTTIKRHSQYQQAQLCSMRAVFAACNCCKDAPVSVINCLARLPTSSSAGQKYNTALPLDTSKGHVYSPLSLLHNDTSKQEKHHDSRSSQTACAAPPRAHERALSLPNATLAIDVNLLHLAEPSAYLLHPQCQFQPPQQPELQSYPHQSPISPSLPVAAVLS